MSPAGDGVLPADGTPPAATADTAPLAPPPAASAAVGPVQPEGEINGPKGPEPTRYGDWEKGGRVSDF